MQKSRRWCGLELDLLPLIGLLACAGCAGHGAVSTPSNTGTRAAEGSASPAPKGSAPASGVAVAAAASAQPAAAPAQSAELEDLPKGTLVLHIGDSFAAALGIDLGKRFKAVGVRNALEFKTASYIPNWSFGGDVPKFVGHYQPDLVLITLGANEIEIPNPEQRAGAIRHLVAELGGRPCVWIAPPLWKPDTGLMKVIRDNVAPCRYLDSNALVHDLPRGHDKIHPNAEGRETWAEIVFQWLSRERVGQDPNSWALKPEPPSSG